MTDNSAVLKTFQRIAHAQDEVTFLNIFKSFPVTYKGQVIAVGRRGIHIQANTFQIVCMDRDQETYIRHRQLDGVVRGRVAAMDLASMQAVLSDLNYVGEGIGGRLQVRVEPDGEMEAILQNADSRLRTRGQVADLSLGGVAVRIISDLFSPGSFSAGTRLNVYLKLPRRGKSLKIPGEVKNTRRLVEKNEHRIGMTWHPDSQSRPILINYISQRQGEIIREIRALYGMIAKIKE